jgi:N-acetylneuraminic acid mutarotase
MKRVLRRVEAYDPATDTWSRLANLPTGLAGMASATLENKFYIIGIRTLRGGSHLDNLFPRLYVYDPITNKWSRKADLPQLLSQGTGFSANGLLYALWGSCDECTLPIPGGRHTARFLFSYDPATNLWTRRADAIYRHRGGGGAMIDGKFYAVTGGISRVNRLEVYDPATDTWTSRAKPPRAGSSAVAAVGKKLFVFGGVFDDPTRVDSYDAATNKWTVAAPLPTRPFSRGAVRLTVAGVPRIFAPGASQGGPGDPIFAVNEMFTP